MLIDKPCCDFQKCKHHFDGNCMNKIEYGRCPYNRQQAEVERLRKLISAVKKDLDIAISAYDKEIAEAKTEAIKEFAERLKEQATSTFYEEHKYVDTEDIDNLVKEMTEENENG